MMPSPHHGASGNATGASAIGAASPPPAASGDPEGGLLPHAAAARRIVKTHPYDGRRPIIELDRTTARRTHARWRAARIPVTTPVIHRRVTGDQPRVVSFLRRSAYSGSASTA